MTSEALIAQELGLPKRGVAAVVALLADKNTVPFIARYRKEATGGLDEVQIRAIEERRNSHIALEARREAIISAIESQGQMTDALRDKLAKAATRAQLEDLYLPYKKKRRTRARVARERGLEPLAKRILAQPRDGSPTREAREFISDEVPDAEAALAGARDIVAEVIAETESVRRAVRDRMRSRGDVASKAARGKSKTKSKFEQYYDFREPVGRIPSHRYLAIARGESEGFLSVSIAIDQERSAGDVERLMSVDRSSPFAPQLREAVADSLKRLLRPSLETEVRADLKKKSDREAVEVFADNLGNLLLAAPLGGHAVIGIDPGLRTGCKCAAVDETGKFIANETIYLTGKNVDTARQTLAAMIRKAKPKAIAVGNGTGGRETEAFVRELLEDSDGDKPFVVSVSESGASVYSASEIARDEFPELDLTVRGAISIARRLQDPLAELVKVDPKSIGVGQYQHDVHQGMLSDKLREVVESCVNRVGVDLNTASAALLGYVAGIASNVAKKIVSHREKNGAFRSRRSLLEVSGLGPKAFEQAAGFLRIRDPEHPLDASAVHPERYELVDRMAKDIGVGLSSLVGSESDAKRIKIENYASGDVGIPTLRDIVAELAKPGRDPRQEFEPPSFRDDIHDITDLTPGMELEGVVTNVTAFGAFVDVGVHQDGLVHISELADHFVKDPSDVVRAGQRIRVRVLSVEVGRKRISLSAKRGAARKPAPAKKTKAKEKKFSNNPFSKL